MRTDREETENPLPFKTNPNRRNELRPPQLKDPDERKKLATKLCDWIQLAQDQKGTLNDRWQKNEQMYRGQPDVMQGLVIEEGAEPQTFNIVKPRVDALVTKVCQPLTANRPFFSAIGSKEDRDRLKVVEDVVQFCFDNAQYSKKLRTMTRQSCMAAPMYWQCHFVMEYDDVLANAYGDALNMDSPYRYVGPALEMIHPNDFIVYPLISGRLERARMCGRRFFMRLRELREIQKTGKFFDTETIYGCDDPQSWESGRDSAWSRTSEVTPIEDKEDEQVAYWEVIVKLDLNGDGFEERYRCVVSETTEELLECEFYGYKVEEEGGDGQLVPYSRLWYASHYVEPPGYNEQFHANPPVQYLQTIQGAYSDLMTLTIEGVKMFAIPAGFVTGGTLSKPTLRYSFGELHYLPTGVTIQFVDPKMDLSAIPVLLQTLKQDADALIRISQNGTAQVQGDSATEAAILEANMDEGAEEYRDNASLSGEDMSDMIREFCYIHYDEMKEAHGSSFPCEDRMFLKKPLRWEASGKTSATNPQVVAQNMKTLWDLVKDPVIGPYMGINISALGKAFVKLMKLPVADSDIFQQPAGAIDGQGQDQQLGGPLEGLVDQLAGAQVPPVSGGPIPEGSPSGTGGAQPT